MREQRSVTHGLLGLTMSPKQASIHAGGGRSSCCANRGGSLRGVRCWAHVHHWGVDVTLLPVTLLIAKSCLFHCLQQAAGPGDRDCTCASERRRARMCSYHLNCSVIGLQGSRKPPRGCQLGIIPPRVPIFGMKDGGFQDSRSWKAARKSAHFFPSVVPISSGVAAMGGVMSGPGALALGLLL